MALYSSMNRSLFGYLRVAASSFPKYHLQNIHGKAITFDVDALDNFTSQLVQEKANKWIAKKSSQKIKNNSVTNNENNYDYSCINDFSIEKINYMFHDLIATGDNLAIFSLISDCIKFRKCPSLSNLMHVLSYCAQKGDKTTIQHIKLLCEEFHPEITQANSNFDDYLAEAIWVKGNISESLKIYTRVYDENPYLRRKIRLTFKYLVTKVVSNRSEAVLINIIKFSQDLTERYKDLFPLTCIWEVCFLSEWYSDQCIALSLLEKQEGLRRTIINRIPFVIAVSLNSHKTEVVYRLLESLLKYEMKPQYTDVLLALLNYQICQGDICRCLEIIRWSVKHDVELPPLHHEEFLNLLLRYNIKVQKPKAPRKHKLVTDYKF